MFYGRTLLVQCHLEVVFSETKVYCRKNSGQQNHFALAMSCQNHPARIARIASSFFLLDKSTRDWSLITKNP